MSTVKAKLFRTDRGVKVLVIEDANNKDFFGIENVPFQGTIENGIAKVAELNGEIAAIVNTAKPDVVIAYDVKMTDSSVEIKIHPMKNSEEGEDKLITNKVVVSGCEEVDSNVLCESNGHAFFALKSEGHECTYSQFLFIDQFKSLKSKLNID
ncbi:MAG: hypothetical protein MJZ24_09155 [Paludibacteraceae bacterium]|nr:hypothetical protein [Paludibacteraceae bacterium]